MKQIELNELQTRLELFGAKLSSEQCEEFRQIIFSIGAFHSSVGNIYKYAEIALIPREKTVIGQAVTKTDEAFQANLVNTTFSGTFKPSAKQDMTSIAIALAKNLELQLKEKKE